ncbi:MAG: hypothetical protein JWO10_503 [Microbacteriaceae bacterium]|nr:hypothetical protein [Microbacteriaceae bacterium]
MAGPDLAQRQPARPRRRRDWITSIAILAGLLVGLAGLHVVLEGAGWYWAIALLCILLLGIGAGARALRWPAWTAPVLQIAALIATVTAVFAPKTALAWIIPTSATWQSWQRTLALAGRSIDEQSIPAIAVPAIMFLLCIGIGAIAITADFLAITTRTPALAGVPLLVLLAVPGFVSTGSSDPLVFVGAAAVYLFLLSIGSRRDQVRLAFGLGGLVIVAALVLPAVLPPVQSDARGGGGGGLSTTVNPVLSRGRDLRSPQATEVLRSGRSEYLRLVSIDNFKGSDWSPDAPGVEQRNTVSAIGDPPGLLADVARETHSTSIEVGQLSSPWLPLPYPSTGVTGLEGSWTWDVNGLAVSSRTTSAAGQTYRATSIVAMPTPAQLLAAGTTVPAGFGRFVSVPRDLPTIVRQTADQVTGADGTNYEKALALQSYFRNSGFTYSESAPVEDGYDGTGGQIIAKFLDAKAGYCIHFASAMAMMARVEGIPSRVAVGFLPGTRIEGEEPTRYQVTSKELHAWPELYFAGVGWIRFEPTVTRGDVPGYADETTPDVPIPSTNDDTGATAATAAPTAAPHGAQSDDAASTGGADSGGPSAAVVWLRVLPFLILFVLLALALAPALVRLLQRSARLRRLRLGTAPVALAWNELMQSSADLGAPVPDTVTPREAMQLVGHGLLADDPSLARMVAALEIESYAKDASGAAYPGLADDLRAVQRMIASYAPRSRRIIAALLPPSIWSLATGLVTR